MKQLILTILLASLMQAQDNVSAARRDWRLQRPLPGLPSLQRPVHVKTGYYACNESGELLNPNKRELQILGECVITGHVIKVKVLQPTDEGDYILGHVKGIIMVLWQSQDVADGNIYTAWVPIAALSN